MPKRNNQFSSVLRIVAVGEERVFPSGFRKRELLVCDDDPKYPVTFPMEFSGDNVDRAAAFQPGDHVAVEFSIAGHEYNGRHFVTIRGFRIERAVKLGGESTVGPQPAAPQAGTLFDAQAERPAPVVPDDTGANIEDLPF